MKLKTTLTVLLGLGIALATSAQNNVGIGTTTPEASAVLDVSSTTQGMLIPRMTAALRIAITGTGGSNPATGLLVYQTDAPAGFWYYNGTAWVNLGASSGGASELQKITEGSNTGWRILGRDPLNYGDIGSDAMDLSYSWSASTTKGATGDQSFASGELVTASGKRSTAMGFGTSATAEGSNAMGKSTTASGVYSTAMGEATTASGRSSTAMGAGTSAKSYTEIAIGSYNTSYTASSDNSVNNADRAFGVGIGTDLSNKKDGLIVYKDGTLAFNKLTSAPTTTTDRFYILNNKVHYNGAEVGGYTATATLWASTTQKHTYIITTGKTFTGPVIITATVMNQPGTGFTDAFSVTIGNVTATTFEAVVYRLDGTSWGQTPVLNYTITTQ